MSHSRGARNSRGYFEAWLRRIQKALARSGRAMEVAMVLSEVRGEGVEVWRERLRMVQCSDDGSGIGFELLTSIEVALAGGEGKEEEVKRAEDQFLL